MKAVIVYESMYGNIYWGITKELRHRGLRPMAEPESFFVDKENQLVSGEEARAEAWGVRLGAEASKHEAG